MQVAATDLDGQPVSEIDFARSAEGRATVNSQLVVATRPIGGRMALVVGDRQYCVPIAVYWQVMGTSSMEHPGDAA
jgi:hypothetical protein